MINWNELQTWSPSCDASTSAGPQSWPSCAHWRASFFLPETRKFCTSVAVACEASQNFTRCKTSTSEEERQNNLSHTIICPSEGNFCKLWLRAPYSLNWVPFLLADAKSLATADSGESYSYCKYRAKTLPNTQSIISMARLFLKNTIGWKKITEKIWLKWHEGKIWLREASWIISFYNITINVTSNKFSLYTTPPVYLGCTYFFFKK